MLFASAVVDEDCVRDDRRRRHAVSLLDDRLHPVCRQYFERRALSRPRNRMCILAHIEGALSSLSFAVVADRLRDRENVSFGKRTAQRLAAMTAGPEDDKLLGVVEIGPSLEIFPFETGDIDQHIFGRRLASEW